MAHEQEQQQQLQQQQLQQQQPQQQPGGDEAGGEAGSSSSDAGSWPSRDMDALDVLLEDLPTLGTLAAFRLVAMVYLRDETAIFEAEELVRAAIRRRLVGPGEEEPSREELQRCIRGLHALEAMGRLVDMRLQDMPPAGQASSSSGRP